MDNPLKKFFGGGLFGNATDSAVGIDIGTSAIKVVEIKKRGGRAMLETYGSISLGSYAGTEAGRVTNLSSEKVVEALQEVLKQSGVSTNSAAFSIPVQSSLIFIIDLPTQIKESEFASIIPTEARKYIPIPITEVSLNYFVIPKKEASYEERNNPDTPVKVEDKTQVLIVATQNEAVSKLNSVVSTCKLDASFYEIEVFSSVRSNFEHELSLVLLMDLGASRTKLSLVEFGIVKAYHTVNRGGADISAAISQTLSIPFPDAEKMKKEYGLVTDGADPNLTAVIKTHMDYIMAETNSVLLAYAKSQNRTISKVILTGGGALMKGFKEVAAENFKSEVVIGHAFSKVGAPAFLDKVLENMSPEFAVSIGLALRKLQ